jgi:hypothetical protein
MTAGSMSLCRLGYMLAVGVLITVALWASLQGPALVAVASFTGWVVSGIIDDRIASRALAWKTALAQGLVSGLTIWLMLRWLDS